MRVLVFMWNSGPGGHAGGFVRTAELLARFERASYDVIDRGPQCVSRTPFVNPLPYMLPKFVERLVAMNYNIGRVADWILSMLAMIAIALRQTRVIRYDRIYVPMSELPHPAIAAFVIGKLRRIPIVFANLNVRGVPGWPLNRVLHDRVDRIITLTSALKDELVAEGIGTPIFINGVGVVDRSIANAPTEWGAIFVGRHTKEKGVFDLISIWKLVRDRCPQARLRLVGPCSAPVRARLERSIVEEELGGGISFIGPVDEDQKWRLYSEASVCVFPSYVEGWGIVPVEALLAGLPVVCYDLPAYKETIANIRGVEIVAPGDVAGAADRIVTFLQMDNAHRIKLEAEVRRESARFAWEPIVAKEEQLILRDSNH